jgi:hypothetical protein
MSASEEGVWEQDTEKNIYLYLKHRKVQEGGRSRIMQQGISCSVIFGKYFSLIRTRVARISKMKDAHKIFIENSEVWRPLGSSWCRWEQNINLDLSEIECKDVNWIQVALRSSTSKSFVRQLHKRLFYYKVTRS